jgi:two-component system NtrC family sensor kinase
MKGSGRNLCKNHVMCPRQVVLFLSMALSSMTLSAQYTVRFVVSHPATKGDIYLAGTFNGWNPGDSAFKLTSMDASHGAITIRNIPRGPHAFKITRGNWAAVESDRVGFDIDDRKLEVTKDTTLNLKVEGWLDAYVDFATLTDSIGIEVCFMKCYGFLERNLDSSYRYGMAGYELSRKIGDRSKEAAALNLLGEVFIRQGNADRALELFLKGLPLAESQHDSFNMANLNKVIGDVFQSENEYSKAKYYYQNTLRYSTDTGLRVLSRIAAYLSLGKIYLAESKLDSAEYYVTKSQQFQFGTGTFLLLGDIQKKSGNVGKAIEYYRVAVEKGFDMNNRVGIADAYLRLSQELSDLHQSDSSFYFARNAYAIATQVKNPSKIVEAGTQLFRLFEKDGRFDSAFLYQKWVTHLNDSLFNQDKERQIHNVVFNEQLRQQALASEQEKFKSRVWIFALAGGLLAMLLTAGLLIRNNRHRKEANQLLQGQKEKIESTLSDLKATQSQLIQSEKMASLGELTAGIAHEIQNPLNFVNNFSGINTELLEDLLDAVRRDDKREIQQLADQLKDNEDKIQVHGKRADGIVKSMLQHSRVSSAQKELTDINALADEYLRLSYHGLRAKDKSFNAALEMDFDPAAGSLNLVPQDIGRVLLNLYNNAFYAVMERKKRGEVGYEPKVRVETRAVTSSQSPVANPESVEIHIIDNGPGIPEAIRAKIFQPFFTTKPTGQGTGLGLSMSYDIVKAHGGELKVETKEGEGSIFIILLPNN